MTVYVCCSKCLNKIRAKVKAKVFGGVLKGEFAQGTGNTRSATGHLEQTGRGNLCVLMKNTECVFSKGVIWYTTNTSDYTVRNMTHHDEVLRGCPSDPV